MKKKIKSALISVWDKQGLEDVVVKLDSLGIDIYSTGGTYEFILNLGIPVTSVEEITGHPEILDGRVKTLHPNIFGGILYKRSSKLHKKQISDMSIPSIDLVIVDLYPFEQTVANMDNDGLTDDDAIEKIDIGGVSLIRAAAKNHKDVIVIGHKDQYGLLMNVLENGASTQFEERREFAIDAFNITSNYDAEVFKYLLGSEGVDDIGASFGLQNVASGITLNVTEDDNGTNDFLVSWEKFGTRPNRVLIQNTYSTKLFNTVMSDLILEKNVYTEILPDSEELIINDRVFAKLDDSCYISYVVVDRNMDNSFIDGVLFLYAPGFDGIQSYVDLLNECLLDFEEDSDNKLNTVTLSANGLEIEPINFHNVDLEGIDLYYPKSTFTELEKAVRSIKKADKGLTILYGDRGTGKTTIINHIASKLDRIVIFIPNNMIEHTINNPEFRRFLKRYEKPIIVIDDCELVLNEIYNKSNITTTNLMQMVEGFLASTLDVNVITIFNTDSEDKIDHNLLECNNLIDVIEFGCLSKEEATDLSKQLGHSKKYKSPTRLVDVINKRKSDSMVGIGF
jgi:hypothetical protein